jgi:hypothetical protein
VAILLSHKDPKNGYMVAEFTRCWLDYHHSAGKLKEEKSGDPTNSKLGVRAALLQ